MNWYLWAIAGGAAAILLALLIFLILSLRARRTQSMTGRREAVWRTQTAAERQMQTVVQDTIEAMFRATRGPR